MSHRHASLQLLAARSGICLLPFSYGIFPFALGARVHIFVVIEMHCLGTGGSCVLSGHTVFTDQWRVTEVPITNHLLVELVGHLSLRQRYHAPSHGFADNHTPSNFCEDFHFTVHFLLQFFVSSSWKYMYRLLSTRCTFVAC